VNIDKVVLGASEADLRAYCRAITVTWALYELADQAAAECSCVRRQYVRARDKMDFLQECADEWPAKAFAHELAAAKKAYGDALWRAGCARRRAEVEWEQAPTHLRQMKERLRGSEDLRALAASLIVYMHERGADGPPTP